MTSSAHSDDRLSWTALAVRMGFTNEQAQRDEILAAIDRITWTPTHIRPPSLEGAVVRVVVHAVFHHRRDQLRRIGLAQLNGGRQLVGLEDSLGTRSYVLDMDSEAIYVLTQFAKPSSGSPAGGIRASGTDDSTDGVA